MSYSQDELNKMKNYYKSNKSQNLNNNIEDDDINDTDEKVSFSSNWKESFSDFFANMGNNSRLFFTTAFFFLGFFIIVVIFDNYIIPSIVHDRAMVEVPNVVGLDLESAKAELEKSNLHYEISEKQLPSSLPEGSVVDQMPKPDKMVKSSRYIYLILSSGGKKIQVPDLQGLNIATIRTVLNNAGLVLGNISYEFSETIGMDSLIWQSKSFGEHSIIGDTINIKISKGSEFSIQAPNLIGMSISNIQQYLNELGLTLGNVDYIDNETFSPGTIYLQNPEAGSAISKTTPINITVTPNGHR